MQNCVFPDSLFAFRCLLLFFEHVNSDEDEDNEGNLSVPAAELHKSRHVQSEGEATELRAAEAVAMVAAAWDDASWPGGGAERA